MLKEESIRRHRAWVAAGRPIGMVPVLVRCVKLEQSTSCT